MVLTLLLNSCQAFEEMGCLKEEPIKESFEGFMNTPQQIETVLYSAYYQVKRYNCFSRYYHTIMESLSDYAQGAGSYEAGSFYNGLDNTLISRTNDVWACLYRAIRFCNTIILQAPGAENATEAEKNALVAEARFLRAFCYMHLCQGWGAVPFYTDKNMHQSGDIVMPRTDVATIYAQCVEDLKFAAQNLPDTQKMAGRPIKSAANTVLTELYLIMREYSLARDAAASVIESGDYALVEVSQPDDFYKLFHPDLVTSTEEIFYLKYADGMDKDLGSCFAAMLHRGGQYFNGSNYYGIWSSYDNRRMAEWPDADLRKTFNIYVVDTEDGEMIYNKKFIATNANGDSAGNDYTLYRYADLLLYFAEAECMANNGPTEAAIEALNQVHRRGYGKPSKTPDPSVDFKLSDYPTAESFMKVLLEERMYETCYEGKRYNDLKRLGKLAEYVLYAKDIVVSPGAYWFPIPNEEFLYNKGLDISKDQNPGY